MTGHRVNFATTGNNIIEVLPAVDPAAFNYNTRPRLSNAFLESETTNNFGVDCDLEGRDEFSKFLEEHEEKVELEIDKDGGGGLVISPSIAARLYSLENLDRHDDERTGKKNKDSQGQGHFQEGKKGWRKYGGIIFGLSASFFFSLTVVMVKILDNYHPLNISVWRYCGILLPSIPLFIYYHCRCPETKRVNLCQAVWPLKEKKKLYNFLGLMLRGLLGCTSVLFRFVSLKYLSVADSSVISYSGPVFVVIVAHFCLGEKCGLISILIAILTSFGVFIIVRPPIFTGEASFDGDTLIGASLALTSMICNSIVLILMRKIREVHSVLMLLTFGAWGVAESLFVATSFGVLKLPQGVNDSILMLLVLPVLVFLGQISIILALKFETAGPVSLIRTCDVVFSFIWQFAFLSVVPDVFSLIGAVIVIVSVCITGFRKWLSTLPEEDSTRIRFRFFLL